MDRCRCGISRLPIVVRLSIVSVEVPMSELQQALMRVVELPIAVIGMLLATIVCMGVIIFLGVAGLNTEGRRYGSRNR